MSAKGIKFEQLSALHKQLVNHFEFHYEISLKDSLYLNLLTYCEQNDLNLTDHIPLTFNIYFNDKLCMSNLDNFISIFDQLEKLKIQNNLDSFEKIDKIEKIDNAQNISPEKEDLIEPDNNELRCSTSKNSYVCIPRSHFLNENLWVLKPTNYNRGRGISVFNNIGELKKLISDYSEGVEENDAINNQNNQNRDNTSNLILEGKNSMKEFVQSNSFIIQKYIENPFLIYGRKFDIRVWVLVNYNLKVYLFKEGYLRTSSKKFHLNSGGINDKSIHLTNNAIQKNFPDYEKYEEGNQLSFNQFQEYLDKEHPSKKYNLRKDIYLQMKANVELSMQSVKQKLNLLERKYCFEIFGYDFIVDNNFKIWLIEVNTYPCLEESSSVLKSLLPRMINDTFKITIDQLFPKLKLKPKIKSNNNRTKESSEISKISESSEIEYPVQGYGNNENMWDFVCQIGISKISIANRLKETRENYTFHHKETNKKSNE